MKYFELVISLFIENAFRYISLRWSSIFVDVIFYKYSATLSLLK